MKTMKKCGALALAALLAFSLCAAALAEGADVPAEAGETPAASENTQAQEDALKEALEAYQSLRSGTRKAIRLESLKKELDTFVASGKLTQEQADLILAYYTEQRAARRTAPGTARDGRKKPAASPDTPVTPADGTTEDETAPTDGTTEGKAAPKKGSKPAGSRPGKKPSGSRPGRKPAADDPGTADGSPDASTQDVPEDSGSKT